MTARVLIADDEPAARDKLRRLLDGAEDFELVGESADGRETAEAIGRLRPDVVFLDVQMPEFDGFQALRSAGITRHAPLIVFVTAYDSYALKAFDVDACDYLLKPFGAVRFQETLQRVRAWLANRNGTAPWLQRVMVKSPGRDVIVNVSDIEWVEAAGNYVRLHTAAGRPMYRQAMGKLLSRLDPSVFARVHRGAIVNVTCITDMKPRSSGDYVLSLRSGERLRLSRSFRAQLRQRLDQRGGK